MIDLGVIEDPAAGEAEPVQFTIAYTRITLDDDEQPAANKETESFVALGEIPYGSVLTYLAASANPNLGAQGAAMVEFLHAALQPADQEKLDRLIIDPQINVKAETLHTVAARLAIHYSTPRLDPTRAASGGNASKSPAGRKATSNGSSGRARGKASTSR